LARFFALILLLIYLPVAAKSIEERLPAKPSKLVTNLSQTEPDFLKPEENIALENKLVNFANTMGVQIAILITDDLFDLDPNDYSTRLFNKWGIGDKANHGVLILVKPTNPRAIYINTGYGSEAYLPDASAKQIIEKSIKPNFKQGLYYQGLDQASDLIISAFGDDIKKAPVEKDLTLPLIFLVVTIFLFVTANEIFGRKRSSLTLGSRRQKHVDNSFLPFLLGYGLGNLGRHSDNHFGGFGGGGGFGGFGGGMSGGGGAGGDW